MYSTYSNKRDVIPQVKKKKSLPHKYSVRVCETNILEEYSIRGNIIDYNDVSMKAFSRSLPHKYSVQVFSMG